MTLDSTCEGSCNPFIACCGARFCTYEELAEHMRQSHPDFLYGAAPRGARPAHEATEGSRNSVLNEREKARAALTALRDFAREHGMGHVERDRLMAILDDRLDMADRCEDRETAAAAPADSHTLSAVADPLAAIKAVHQRMVAFATTRPSPQQTRQKTPREMVEYYAMELEPLLAHLEASCTRLRDERDWQLIETAPMVVWKRLLLSTEVGVVVGYWDGARWRREIYDECKPTHWMSLPGPALAAGRSTSEPT